MKKQVKTHLVAQSKEGYEKGDICINTETKEIDYSQIYTDGNSFWQAQNIYVTDETLPIIEGSWVIGLIGGVNTGKIVKVLKPALFKDLWAVILATSDPILHADGIPNVSEEFKAEYCRLQGVGIVHAEYDHHINYEGYEVITAHKGEEYIVTDAAKCAILTIEGEKEGYGLSNEEKEDERKWTEAVEQFNSSPAKIYTLGKTECTTPSEQEIEDAAKFTIEDMEAFGLYLHKYYYKSEDVGCWIALDYSEKITTAEAIKKFITNKEQIV